MSLMSTIATPNAESAPLPASLASFVKEKAAQLDGIAIPTRKTESWKYSAKHLGELENLPLSQGDGSAALAKNGPELDCYELQLVNGSIVGQAPAAKGLSVKPFSSLSDEESAQVTGGVTATSSFLPLADLNAARLQEGWFIALDDKTELDKPLKLVIRQTAGGMSMPRVFLRLGKLANMTLIEEISASQGADETAFVNSVTDCDLGAASQLTYIRMNLDTSALRHSGATGIALHRDARLDTHCLALGSVMGRHDLRVEMIEPGAECDLNAVTVTMGKQHFDHHTCIEHIAANCVSNENYRCIAGDQSHIVFNGRIHIHRDAQKTLGSMSNKNLLLTSHAEIDSKPELEIYADDVKCTHGTTIGQLNEKEVYYLKTRGIKDNQARQMLTLGFVLELVRQVPLETIAEYWEQVLSDLLRFES